jgi:hypothetical protein
MFSRISEIFACELKILRLRKQVRALESQGESLALVLKKEELLVQLQINLRHPFGFKDMKHLAIAELKKDLQKVAHPSKAQRVRARKIAVIKKLETLEV